MSNVGHTSKMFNEVPLSYIIYILVIFSCGHTILILINEIVFTPCH